MKSLGDVLAAQHHGPSLAYGVEDASRHMAMPVHIVVLIHDQIRLTGRLVCLDDGGDGGVDHGR